MPRTTSSRLACAATGGTGMAISAATSGISAIFIPFTVHDPLSCIRRPVRPRCSALQRSRREPADQMALQEGEEDGHGDGADDHACRELAPLDLVLAHHEEEPRGER